MATARMQERKQRDREGRRGQILRTARQTAEQEGWSSVTIRRLAEEIGYSQPVLYSHFESREAIVTAVAVEGFQELGVALQEARQSGTPGDAITSVAEAYLQFASRFPALYEAMFSLKLKVPFDDPGTPEELHFAFAQVFALFRETTERAETKAELFWASLHGIAELTRTKRLPTVRAQGRLEMIVGLFRGQDGEDHGRSRSTGEVPTVTAASDGR